MISTYPDTSLTSCCRVMVQQCVFPVYGNLGAFAIVIHAPRPTVRRTNIAARDTECLLYVCSFLICLYEFWPNVVGIEYSISYLREFV